MLKRLKPFIAALVLLATTAGFAHYILQHPQSIEQLRQVHPLTIVLLLAIYSLTLVSLAFVQSGTLELCRTKLEYTEAFLLTSYTALINFFGPLQSGPGFRAVYLKKKYGTKLKNYALATLVYLGAYAGFSGLFLISGIVGWPLLVSLALVGILAWFGAIRLNLPFLRRFRELALSGTFKIILATLAQVSLIAVIYFIELRTVNQHIHFGQAIIYTGAANFALFVSLTPGAIGFRESFLLFSRHLHHIDNTTIVNASLLDRGVYVVFLVLVALLVVATHARQRLNTKSADD